MPDALDYESFRANVRRLAEGRIAPHAAGVDEEARFPVEARETFQAMELAGLAFLSSLGWLCAQISRRAPRCFVSACPQGDVRHRRQKEEPRDP